MSVDKFSKKYQRVAKEAGIDSDTLEQKVMTLEKAFDENTPNNVASDIAYIKYNEDHFTVGELALLKMATSDLGDSSFKNFGEDEVSESYFS